MNSRRVHQLMRERFPEFSHVELNWRLLCRGAEGESVQVLQYLREHFADEELLVEVTRKSAGLHKLEDAAAIIAKAAGSSEILVANRSFTSFTVVGVPGVAASWHVESMGNP